MLRLPARLTVLLLALASAAYAGDPEPGSIVARVNGDPVTTDELLAYFAEARPVDYRPSTAAEARRLLDGLLRMRIVEQEARALGLGAGVACRQAYYEHWVETHGAAPSVRDAEVDAFLARHSFAAASASEDPTALREAISVQLLASKQRLQRRALADRLVAETPVWVSTDTLMALVEAPNTLGSQHPPRPPSERDRSTERETGL